jgi:hypothetical protein
MAAQATKAQYLHQLSLPDSGNEDVSLLYNFLQV